MKVIIEKYYDDLINSLNLNCLSYTSSTLKGYSFIITAYFFCIKTDRQVGTFSTICLWL